ncbi:MAG TPA: DUF971 domain-containing protein [Dongiaceae bacterium]|nr:DUF971 domain-containing protein [Dongiaceae bacterium]
MSGNVTVQSSGRWLRIDWQEGESTELSAQRLRSHCRCASCRAEHMQDRFHPDPYVRLRDVRLFGVASLHITFSDGHSRGVFPWEYLRTLARDEKTNGENSSSSTLDSMTLVQRVHS